MQKEEVMHLARLARIAITEDEATQFTTEIDAILSYVGDVQAVVGTDAVEPTVGPVHNVFREDVVTNQPNQYTDTLLAAMPETDGRFMKVKKILTQDD
jgi:aspartyl-tRNA(Asn)/glutamyl-tRNA(Gln) amidotransferase subunit C